MTVNGVGSVETQRRGLEPAERAMPPQPGGSRRVGDADSRVRDELEVPRGTDPELWRILSREERDRFARAGAMGPLTYGYLINSGRNDLPVVRGGRLDVKA